MYDYYISDKLFNSHNRTKEERQLVGKTDKNREQDFTRSLKDLFKIITPFVESSLEFGKSTPNFDFGNVNGEFDVIIYFEDENILIPIEVKLSNVSPRSEKRKKTWLTHHIETKGVQQIAKYVTLLQTEVGLKFITDQLKIKTQKDISQARIYPLIVTDHFFVDHCTFAFDEHDNQVKSVSYFELKQIILNEKIHPKQEDWLPFENSNAASQLINLIEKNTFWNFLDDIAENFSYSESLSPLINEEYRIEMKTTLLCSQNKHK